MKNIAKLAVFAALLASAQAARAGQPDFDGAGYRQVPFAEQLDKAQAPEAAAPAGETAEGAGAVLNVTVEKNATSKPAFAADGARAEVHAVKFLIKVKSPAAESEWAVGGNDKIYALGAARQAPEFSAVRKLAEALALNGNPAAKTRGNKCETVKSYVCISGQTNECRVDRCGWCGKWPDGTWGCEWSTESAPYACSPNGMRC